MKTISAFAAAATEPASTAPAWTSRATGSALMSWTSTFALVFFTRCRHIGSPMTPRPMKPKLTVAVMFVTPEFSNDDISDTQIGPPHIIAGQEILALPAQCDRAGFEYEGLVA